MARKGDGLVLSGKTWWLDFHHNGTRHQVKLGKGINRTVAAEIAITKRARVLRGESGIGRKAKDISYEDARNEFLAWAKANKKPRILSLVFYSTRRGVRGENVDPDSFVRNREIQTGAAGCWPPGSSES